MYNTYPKIDHPCKCCGGSGVQMNKDGIKINCPVCVGTGQQGGSTRPQIWCKKQPNNFPIYKVLLCKSFF